MATILIVDDLPINREVLVNLLGYYDHKLLEANDGAEAIAIARNARPDLIITDVLMPTMDGYEFVRQLRAEREISDIPVVFYTAFYLEREARALAASCDVSYIIQKPSEPEAVLKIVSTALGLDPRAVQIPVAEGFDREHLRLLTDKLSDTTADLKATIFRLTALVEIGQQLALEHDSKRLLERYCSAAREILGAACACITILDENGSISFAHTVGVEKAWADKINGQCEPFAGLTDKRKPFRLRGSEVDGIVPLFGSFHAPVRSFLAAPLVSPGKSYGWLRLWNKLGHQEFSSEDEQLAATLGTQLGIAYEDACLHDATRRHTEELEREIADRKRAEEMAKQLNESLEERVATRTEELSRSNASLEQYAFAAAHDLQEPLRTVNIYTQLLLDRFKLTDDEEVILFGRFVGKAVGRMNELLTDLLLFARVVDRDHLHPEPFVLSQSLDDAVFALQESLKKSSGRVDCDDLPRVVGNRLQLALVFQNLLSNSLKYASPENPPAVHVSARRDGAMWRISVKDNGIGFDPSYREQIFGLFKRLYGNEYPGTGIGLAICRRIIETSGGRIWADSEIGHGSTFTFTVPAVVSGDVT